MQLIAKAVLCNRGRPFAAVGAYFGRMLFAASFSLVSTLYKNVLPFQNVAETAFCPNSVNTTHSEAQHCMHSSAQPSTPSKHGETAPFLLQKAKHSPRLQREIETCLLAGLATSCSAHQPLAALKQCPPPLPTSETILC